MKTNFKAIMMPFVVMVLGVVGAFTTMSMGKAEVLAPSQGYYFVSLADRCHMGIECDLEEGDICKWGDIVQVGKTNPSDVNCPVTLYKPVQ